MFLILLHIWHPCFCLDRMAWVCKCLVVSFCCLLLFSLVFQFRRNVGLANSVGLQSCVHTSKQLLQVVFLCVCQSQTGIHKNIGLHSSLTHTASLLFAQTRGRRCKHLSLFGALLLLIPLVFPFHYIDVGHPNFVGVSTHPQMSIGMR